MTKTTTTTTSANPRADSPGVTIERTAKRLKHHFQQHLHAAGADLTIDQWVVLRAIAPTDGIGPLELAKATYKDAPTLTRILDLLCQKGLAERHPDTVDRRRYNLHLTPAGRDKLAEVEPAIRAARAQAWQGVPAHRIEELLETLNMVYGNLEGGRG